VCGTSGGINLAPGSDDDGWVIPPPVQLSDGTQIQLFKDGEAWHAAFEAMKLATHRICLELYIFASDHTGQAVADLLSEKARSGVKVYVLYDSFGSLYADRGMFERMRQAGVHMQEFHPMRPWECKYGWRAFNRDHRKLLIIDDQIAGLGGMNLGYDYAGSWIVKSAMAGSAPDRMRFMARQCDWPSRSGGGLSAEIVRPHLELRAKRRAHPARRTDPRHLQTRRIRPSRQRSDHQQPAETGAVPSAAKCPQEHPPHHGLFCPG